MKKKNICWTMDIICFWLVETYVKTLVNVLHTLPSNILIKLNILYNKFANTNAIKKLLFLID